MITRHDIPEIVKKTIEKAMEIGVIDALSIYELAVKHNDDFDSLMDEIITIAYCTVHEDGGKKHHAICKEAERFWRNDNFWNRKEKRNDQA